MKLLCVVAFSCCVAAPAFGEDSAPAPREESARTSATARLIDADLSRYFLPEAMPSEDNRRTLEALPRNLGRSVRGVFSKRNLTPLLIGAAITGLAAPVDSHVQAGLLGKAPGVSQAASTAGGFSVMAPATLGLFLAGSFSHDPGLSAFSYDAGQAVIVTGLYTTILKKAVQRMRPDGSDSLSFPSGHSSTAFALATVADRHYGWKVGLSSYLAASTIALSRVSNNKHHLTDVLAGATIGVISARTVMEVNGDPPGRKRRFSLAPMSDPQGGGVGVGALVSW